MIIRRARRAAARQVSATQDDLLELTATIAAAVDEVRRRLVSPDEVGLLAVADDAADDVDAFRQALGDAT